MRLKYQLRGLGIGIIIAAALLMGTSDDEKASVKNTDTMVMASTDKETAEDISTTETPGTSEVRETTETETSEMQVTEIQETSDMEESVVEAETVSEDSESLSTEEVVSEEETSMVETSNTEVSTEEESTEKEVDSNAVEIKIVSGDDSGTVARKLQIAGLVDNASEYDAYLMQHGYDKKISVGTVYIAKGSSWLEIAEKISGRK